MNIGCETPLLRRDFSRHLLECTERLVECNMCHERMTYSLIHSHINAPHGCPRFALCSDGCSAIVHNSRICEHREVCPNQPVQCPVCEQICANEKELDGHLSDPAVAIGHLKELRTSKRIVPRIITGAETVLDLPLEDTGTQVASVHTDASAYMWRTAREAVLWILEAGVWSNPWKDVAQRDRKPSMGPPTLLAHNLIVQIVAKKTNRTYVTLYGGRNTLKSIVWKNGRNG